MYQSFAFEYKILFIHVNIAIDKRFDSGINVMSRHTFERILVKFH